MIQWHTMNFTLFMMLNREGENIMKLDTRELIDETLLRVIMGDTYQKILCLLGSNGIKFNKNQKEKLKQVLFTKEKDNYVNAIYLKEFLSVSIHSAAQKKRKIFRSLKDAKNYVREIRNHRKNIPQIGLGIESRVRIPRVKSAEVTFDKNTKLDKIHEKSILYTAGWAINGTFTEDE